MTLSETSLSSALLTAFAVIQRQAVAIARWHEGRRGYRLLCELDQRALRDLGPTPGDLGRASQSGYLDDPTRILTVRTSEAGKVAKESDSPAGGSLFC